MDPLWTRLKMWRKTWAARASYRRLFMDGRSRKRALSRWAVDIVGLAAAAIVRRLTRGLS
jgi:hypothetical protein